MTPFDLIVSRLQQRGTPPVKRGTGWMSICPGHEDRHPSLSINETENGNVLINCFSGCNPKDLLDNLDLTLSDLFTPDPARTNSKRQKEYIYHDENGERLYRVVKYLEPDGHKTFRQQAALPDGWAYTMGDTRRVIYYLPRVLAGIKKGRPIWIVEGEKDVENLSFATGAIATCNPGGADNGSGNKFTDQMVDSLDGAKTINICIDNDTPGTRHGHTLAQRLTRPGRHIRIFSSPTGKDISDHLENFGTVETLNILWDSEHPTDWPENGDTTPPSPVEHGDWELQPLTTLSDGNNEPTIPTILQCPDGLGLFYAGKINSIYGQSGSGKTWLLIEALAEQIRQGHHVAYIDFEDRYTTLEDRLQDLNITRQQLDQAHYVHPQMASQPQQIEDIVQYCSRLDITVIGIDSAGEGLALASADPNSDDDVATWYREIPRRLADAGACVILVDHSPKNTEHSKGHAIGSQRKKAAIDGASYEIKTREPFSKGTTGSISITCSKDRHGNHASGKETAQAIVHIGNPDGPGIRLYDPKDPLGNATKGSKEVTPEDCQQIYDWLSEQPDPLPRGKIENAKHGHRLVQERARNAVSLMLCDGRIVKVDGGYITPKMGNEQADSLETRCPTDSSDSLDSLRLVAPVVAGSLDSRCGERASENPDSLDSLPPYGLKGATSSNERGLEPPQNDDDPYSNYNLFEMDNPTDPRSFTQ